MFLLALAFITLIPIIYSFFGSFKSNMELMTNGANIMPEKFVFEKLCSGMGNGGFQNLYDEQCVFVVFHGYWCCIYVLNGWIRFCQRQFPGQKDYFCSIDKYYVYKSWYDYTLSYNSGSSVSAYKQKLVGCGNY